MEVVVNPIQRHPLDPNKWMHVAPKEINPYQVPYIGTKRECEKAVKHLMRNLANAGYKVINKTKAQ